MKLINKTGLKKNKTGLKIALLDAIHDGKIYDGKIYNNYKINYNYNFSNNGNSWLQTTVYFRKSKKVWIAEQ